MSYFGITTNYTLANILLNFAKLHGVLLFGFTLRYNLKQSLFCSLLVHYIEILNSFLNISLHKNNMYHKYFFFHCKEYNVILSLLGSIIYNRGSQQCNILRSTMPRTAIRDSYLLRHAIRL